MRSRTLPPRSVVDRRVERLPHDVPERHLDPRLRLLDAVQRAVHLPDEVGDAERVLADHGGDERASHVPRQEPRRAA